MIASSDDNMFDAAERCSNQKRLEVYSDNSWLTPLISKIGHTYLFGLFFLKPHLKLKHGSNGFHWRKKKKHASHRSVCFETVLLPQRAVGKHLAGELIYYVSAKCFIFASFCEYNGFKKDKLFNYSYNLPCHKPAVQQILNNLLGEFWQKKKTKVNLSSLTKEKLTCGQKKAWVEFHSVCLEKKKDLWNHPWIKKKKKNEPKLPRVF